MQKRKKRSEKKGMNLRGYICQKLLFS